MCEKTFKAAFETECCSRCGGSGHYSYCTRYGTTCFRCNGRGVTLTKRGVAAQQFLRNLRTKPASAVVVGDVIQMTGVTMDCQVYLEWATVTEVGVVTDGGSLAGTIRLETTKGSWAGLGSDSPVVFRGTKEFRIETMRLAKEFQATLGRNGKPRVKGRSDEEQDALNAERAAKARARKEQKLAEAREARETAERLANGGLTDREVWEQERAREAAEVEARKAQAKLDNAWLVEVLEATNSSGSFVPAMIVRLRDEQVKDLSGRCVEVLREIYAKQVGGRKGSKGYEQACELFDERAGLVVV